MRTWEEGASEAADKISDFYQNADWAIEDVRRRLSMNLESIREDPACWSTTDSWAGVGSNALHAYLKAGVTYWSAAEALDDTLETVISKQHDYGHGNILAYGIQGVCVRLSDKWARIQNLEKKGVNAKNESLLDSYLDLVGYCIIAIMLCEGTFELPLEEDLLPTRNDAVVSLDSLRLEQVEFVKNEIAKAIDAHLAAFHPAPQPIEAWWQRQPWSGTGQQPTAVDGRGKMIPAYPNVSPSRPFDTGYVVDPNQGRLI